MFEVFTDFIGSTSLGDPCARCVRVGACILSAQLETGRRCFDGTAAPSGIRCLRGRRRLCPTVVGGLILYERNCHGRLFNNFALGHSGLWCRCHPPDSFMDINEYIRFIDDFSVVVVVSKRNSNRRRLRIRWTHSPINSSITSSRVTTPRAPRSSLGYSDTRTMCDLPS